MGNEDDCCSCQKTLDGKPVLRDPCPVHGYGLTYIRENEAIPYGCVCFILEDTGMGRHLSSGCMVHQEKLMVVHNPKDNPRYYGGKR
jgi:hypothetical protein